MSATAALVKRAFLNSIRNPMLIRSKLIQGTFLSLYTGGLYFDMGTNDYTKRPFWVAITGLLFLTTLFGLMSGITPIALSFPLEREVFFK